MGALALRRAVRGNGPDGSGLDVLDVYGLGATVADYDNDGRDDVFLTTVDGGRLFHNEGNGRFTDVTERAGIRNANFAVSAAWLDYDRDGFADVLYVGDIGGNVWRVNVTDPDKTNWPIAKVAVLSSGTNTDIANKRRFVYPPDVVFSSDASGTYSAILLGSGHREHPFDGIVVNRFYMIKDRPNAALVTDADLFDATSEAGSNEFGFKLTLGLGEKVIGGAVTLASTTFFNTNQPSFAAGADIACTSNLGVARQYLINFQDASATTDLNSDGTLTIADRSMIHAGGGYLPAPVPAVVTIDGQRHQAVIAGTAVFTPPMAALDTRKRVYWFKTID